MRTATILWAGATILLSSNILAGAAETIAASEDAKNGAFAAHAARFAKREVLIDGDFREGWQQTVPLELPDDSVDQVTLWVQDGWLAARRNSGTGSLEWQLFLCPIQAEAVPKLFVRDKLNFIEVSYHDERYFIRDSEHIFRCRRLLKTDGELFSKKGVLSDGATRAGSANSNTTGLQFDGWIDNEWYGVTAGPSEDRLTSFVRVNPDAERNRGYGVQISATGLTHFFHGDCWLIDDGELIIANRRREGAYLAKKRREAAQQAILSGGDLPAINVSKWINSKEELDWDKLKGKVVLVDFWGTWCGPCVAKLPDLQPLHEKYADQGLVIIAIHSAQGLDACEAFIREQRFTFPVAIDSGKTAKEFAISGWPTYFLIDRAGKVVEGFSHATPTEEAIVKLIDSAAE